MKNLINGILDFRRNILPSLTDMFKHLDKGQSPDTLFVACSDSRVVPNLFASTSPGEMFVVRNVGNLIPPCLDKSKNHDHNHNHHNQFVDSAGAALEFSSLNLKVKNIVACGHSKCGAMGFLNQGKLDELKDSMPYIYNWLHNGKTSVEKLTKYKADPTTPLLFKGLSEDGDVSAHFDLEVFSDVDVLSQVNALQQLEHVASYKVVQERIKNKEVIMHAWWFNIANAEVWAFSDRKQKFLLLDEERAQVLLEKIESYEKGSPKKDNSPNGDYLPPWLAGIGIKVPKKNK